MVSSRYRPCRRRSSRSPAASIRPPPGRHPELSTASHGFSRSPVRERVLGPELPETLLTSRQLATCAGEAGDPAAARDQLAALLPCSSRSSAPEHPDTLATRHTLAIWIRRADDDSSTA